MLQLIGALLMVFVSVASAYTDEANARLPRFFHLDDYDRCLSQKDGLYCLGIFELSPLHHSPITEYIKEYSSHPLTFNRSRLHRGYCVSERCPSTERNATVRFERCVSERAHRHALTARLHTLHHCTSHLQHTATPQPLLDNQLIFIQIVVALLALNVAGTVYDVATGDDHRRIGILKAWSIRASWQKLTATYVDGDPRLKELELLNGIRVFLLWIALYVHVVVIHYQYYVVNPHFLEQFLVQTFGMMLSNGSSLIQIFVMISNFLVGYNLLIYVEKHRLSLSMLPALVVKRFVRIAPVHILLVGFTATWWPSIFTGPLQPLIEEQSAICRRKFWSHALFFNNMVDKHSHCLMPSWFLPVDMHLYILACILIIVMQHRRQQARRLLGVAFIISSIAGGVVNYFYKWQTPIQYSVPNNIQVIFSNVEAFGEFYISTWGSMMACFLGLYIAFLFYDLREAKYNLFKNKWVKSLHPWCAPLMAVWVIALGSLARRYNHRLFTALYTIVDRPAFVVLASFALLGMLKLEGINRSFFSWSGWRVPARLSLPVMLCNWLVMNYIAARPTVYYVSMFTLTADYLALVILTYATALPISLLVEIPVQRFISHFI